TAEVALPRIVALVGDDDPASEPTQERELESVERALVRRDRDARDSVPQRVAPGAGLGVREDLLTEIVMDDVERTHGPPEKGKALALASEEPVFGSEEDLVDRVAERVDVQRHGRAAQPELAFGAGEHLRVLADVPGTMEDPYRPG